MLFSFIISPSHVWEFWTMTLERWLQGEKSARSQSPALFFFHKFFGGVSLKKLVWYKKQCQGKLVALGSFFHVIFSCHDIWRSSRSSRVTHLWVPENVRSLHLHKINFWSITSFPQETRFRKKKKKKKRWECVVAKKRFLLQKHRVFFTDPGSVWTIPCNQLVGACDQVWGSLILIHFKTPISPTTKLSTSDCFDCFHPYLFLQ